MTVSFVGHARTASRCPDAFWDAKLRCPMARRKRRVNVPSGHSFEDIEPHRLEDLVHELIYDFRDWHSIEAAGQARDDAGFDIPSLRAITEP
jgi:hypothetical protein